MKTVLTTMMAIFESFGKARAAAYFSRIGDHEAAKRIMAE